MPPKKTTTRKQSSSIAQAFKAQGKATTAAGKGAAKGAAKGASISSLPKGKPVTTTPSRSTSPEKKQISTLDGQGLTQDEVHQASSLPHLEVEDKRWDDIWRHVKKEKLGKVGAIHAVDQNRIHHILRNFDLDPTYGPCLGMTRMERWKRANALGEEPPAEVLEILSSQEGVLKEEYREACLAPMGV